jgi:hypothetical protein
MVECGNEIGVEMIMANLWPKTAGAEKEATTT